MPDDAIFSIDWCKTLNTLNTVQIDIKMAPVGIINKAIKEDTVPIGFKTSEITMVMVIIGKNNNK